MSSGQNISFFISDRHPTRRVRVDQAIDPSPHLSSIFKTHVPFRRIQKTPIPILRRGITTRSRGRGQIEPPREPPRAPAAPHPEEEADPATTAAAAEAESSLREADQRGGSAAVKSPLRRPPSPPHRLARAAAVAPAGSVVAETHARRPSRPTLCVVHLLVSMHI